MRALLKAVGEIDSYLNPCHLEYWTVSFAIAIIPHISLFFLILCLYLSIVKMHHELHLTVQKFLFIDFFVFVIHVLFCIVKKFQPLKIQHTFIHHWENSSISCVCWSHLRTLKSSTTSCFDIKLSNLLPFTCLIKSLTCSTLP